MAIILYLETATNICSVALAENTMLLSIRETEKRNSHAELITVLIQELLTEAGITFAEIDAVAVSKGPGSYTGLRIGVSTAKGICYALGKPLISVGTLHAMAYGAQHFFPDHDNTTIFCPMIDARRMEVYYALFDNQLKEIKPSCAEIINSESFSELLNQHKIIFFGDGAEKCKALLSEKQNGLFPDQLFVSAQHMIIPALEKYNNNDFESTAYFEPFYLKDFVAGASKVKGLK